MPKESIDNQPESSEKAHEHEVESIPRVSGGLLEQNELALPVEEEVSEVPVASERRQIARSASLVMLGNLGSSVLGMVRQIVVACPRPNAALLAAAAFYFAFFLYEDEEGVWQNRIENCGLRFMTEPRLQIPLQRQS